MRVALGEWRTEAGKTLMRVLVKIQKISKTLLAEA